MGLRTTSTRIPLTSMNCLLILTLVLHDLENIVRAGLVFPQLLADGAQDFSLLEPVAPQSLYWLASMPPCSSSQLLHRER